MYLNKDGNTTNDETPFSCAGKCNGKYYVKVNESGFLYDPHGLYVQEDDLTKVDPYKGKLLFNWSEVEEYVYANYIYFLKNKSRTGLSKAQNIINNSNGPHKEKFKRSGK